jgi:nucleoid DNA-binding protein
MMSPDASKKAPSKTEILTSIGEKTQLSKAQIAGVFDALSEEIGAALDGAGSFTIPGLVKIERKHVPAKPARTGVPNPFKPGELMDVPAKPASTKITVRALKQLKDMGK